VIEMTSADVNETWVRVHIDQHSYHSPNPTTGEALYGLAEIRPEFQLYKEVEGDREDEWVPRDSQEVHVHEDEHFHTAPARPGVTIDIGELLRYCSDGLPAFKAPKQIVLSASLPKTERGKLDRKVLVDLWRRETQD